MKAKYEYEVKKVQIQDLLKGKEKHCKCCGKKQTGLISMKVDESGYWFDCSCGGTMLIRTKPSKKRNKPQNNYTFAAR